jgi:hypothetical protein
VNVSALADNAPAITAVLKVWNMEPPGLCDWDAAQSHTRESVTNRDQ